MMISIDELMCSLIISISIHGNRFHILPSAVQCWHGASVNNKEGIEVN